MNVVVINFRPFLPVARGVSIHVTASIAFSVASISHGFQKLSRMIYGIALSQPTSFYFEYPSFCFHRFMPNKSPEPTAVGAGSSATRFTSRVGGGSAFFVRSRGHALWFMIAPSGGIGFASRSGLGRALGFAAFASRLTQPVRVLLHFISCL